MERCKHAIVESGFSTSFNKDTGEFEEYDFHDDIPHSKKGVWICPDIICDITGDANKQFNENRGFFYCDEKRCRECAYYEGEKNGKEIKVKIRSPIDSRLRHEVFKRDEFRCKECGRGNKETVLHVDHIIPVSQGGSDELCNLQTLCSACNLNKSNKCFIGGKNG